jgi:hypothetical protein
MPVPGHFVLHFGVAHSLLVGRVLYWHWHRLEAMVQLRVPLGHIRLHPIDGHFSSVVGRQFPRDDCLWPHGLLSCSTPSKGCLNGTELEYSPINWNKFWGICWDSAYEDEQKPCNNPTRFAELTGHVECNCK